MTAETLNAQLASIYKTYAKCVYSKEWEDNVSERLVDVMSYSLDQTCEDLVGFSRTETLNLYPENVREDKPCASCCNDNSHD